MKYLQTSFRFCIFLAFFSIASLPARAQPANDYFNTGTNGTGGILPAGSADQNWQISTTLLSGYTPATVMIPVAGAYYASPWPDAQWISGNINGSHTGNVIFYYKITFSLPLLDPCGNSYSLPNSFCLNLDFFADNSVNEIYINGVPQSAGIPGIPDPDPYFSVHFNAAGGYSLSLCNGWLAGTTNELIVAVASGGPFQGFLSQSSINPPPPSTTTYNDTICAGQSYAFGDSTFTTAGSHTANLGTIAGCDSFVTLNLAVNPTYNSDFYDTICQGTPYFFGGSSYTSTGDFPSTFATMAGCDSTVTLHLFVNPTPSINLPVTICQGQSYVFANIPYSSAGSYTSTFITAAGCDSIVTLQLTVSPTYTGLQNAIVCPGASFTFAGTPYTAGTYQVALTTTSGCDSTITLTVSEYPPAIGTLDTSVCQGNNFVFNGQTFNAPGTYPLPFTSASGCDSTLNLILSFNPPPITNVKDTICQGEFYAFGTTQLGNTGTYINNIPTLQACDSIVNLDLYVYHMVPGANFTIRKGCQGDTVDFSGTTALDPAQTFYWNFGDGSPIDTGLAVQHIYAVQGTYQVTAYAVFNSCSEPAVLFVNTAHPLTASFLTSADSACVNAPVTFTGTALGIPPISYLWFFGDGNTAANNIPANTYTSAGQYTATQIAFDGLGCTDTARRLITIVPLPSPTLTFSDTAACTGAPLTLALSYNGSYETLLYSFGDGSFVENTDQLTHAWDTSGQFIITLDANHRFCPDTRISQIVTILPLPGVNIGPDTSLCPGGEPLALSNSLFNITATYVWSTGDSNVNSILARSPGIYWLQASNAGGCSTTDSLEVFKDCYLDVPNAFSPDGDGVNDYFFPRQLLGASLSRFRMQIFNRWGAKVFETTSLDGRGWDGRYGSKEQNTGVYIYLIEAAFTNGTLENYQGNVTLLR